MNKLKPILAQKFWILFFVVLIMPLTGYFTTTGKLDAEISDRRKKLIETFTAIPSGSGVPNDSWSATLSNINDKQKLFNRRANQELWLKQKERMFWPKDIAAIMEKAEYFKDLTEQQKGDQVTYKYPLSYRSQIRNLWEIVDPLDEGSNFRDSDRRKKIAFAMADLHQSNRIVAENLQPSFSDIWAAQEDIWLQTELLKAIWRMNANASNQGDAAIKQLGKILLFGGTKSSGDAGAVTGGTSSGMGDITGMGQLGGMGFGSGRAESSSVASVDINLAEEFAVAPDPSAGGNAGGGGGGFGGGVSSEMLAGVGGGAGGGVDGSSGSSGSSGGGVTGGAKTETKRYIDLDEAQPYKRRGFYIKLTMNHRKVPDLIAELMDSPFPVEIIRVQQVWLSDSGNSSGGGGPMGTNAMGGFSAFRPPSSSGDATSLGSSGSAGGFADSGDDPMGLGSSGSAGSTGRTASSNPGSAAALSDPNLAQVTILGVFTLYLPPPPATNAEQGVPSSSTATAAELAVSPGKVIAPEEPLVDSAPAVAKPTAEPSGETGDEAKKPEDPDAPKSEATKPEKPEADTDNATAEKTPPKKAAADNSDSETK